MKKIALVLLTLTLQFLGASCSRLNTSSMRPIRILHYNIFELETAKINKENSQLKAVKDTVKAFKFDLLSVNEIQYDLPRVPTPKFNTTGENLRNLTEELSPKNKWFYSFFPANTGALAKQKKNSHYVTSQEKNARSYADPNNYGLFPGQYSTGLSSRFPIKSTKVISHLPWKHLNPKVNLKFFTSASGAQLPDNIELFDKNFVDTIVIIEGKPVHIITLHTVPAYHFGNKKSPNYQRNADQLAFLEWYLDPASPLRISKVHKTLLEWGIQPLKSSDHFIAMGDWNTDIKAKNPGSVVLRRLYKSLELPLPTHITHESSGYDLKPFTMQLDYILYSSSFISLQEQVIRSRPGKLSQKCRTKLTKEEEETTMTLVPLKSKKNCKTIVPISYAQQKTASDHFALYTQLQFKD